MSGIKGKSGRKPSPANITKFIYNEIDSHWAELVAALISNAVKGDKECLMYCFDRRIGKPKQQTTFELEGAELLGAGMVTEILRVVAVERERLKSLEQPKQLPEAKTDSNYT